MDHDHRAELEALRALVLEAGDLLLAHLGAADGMEAKAGTEFVTDMDRRSEELLLAGLARPWRRAVVGSTSGWPACRL